MFSTALSDETFSRFRPARVFLTANSPQEANPSSGLVLSGLSSIDVDPVEGDFALASHGKFNALTLFNARLGVVIQRTAHIAGESGVALARFTRRTLDSTVLIVPRISHSDTLSYALRTYSLLQSATVRTFAGHGQQVCSISQSPSDEGFVSGDVGGEVRVWDARSNVGCIGRLRMPDSPSVERASTESYVSYHPDGSLISCVNATTGILRVMTFDLRNLPRGPCKSFIIPHETKSTVRIMGAEPHPATPLDFKVSSDGTMFVIVTDQDSVIGVDTMDGRVLFENECTSTKANQAVASFSADSK
jgi:hypothetical protein